MKQTDVAALVLIVAIAGVISYFAVGAIVGSPQKDPVEVEKVPEISSTFVEPDKRVFNEDAIDPTVNISGDGPSADRPFID